MHASIHHPSEAKVAWKISSILPVGPPLHPWTNIRFPKSVLYNTEMVWATLCLAIVKRHCNAVWLGSVKQSSVNLLLSNNFFHVPTMNLVGCGMHWRDSLVGIWSNSCLLVGVLAILELKNFTDEDSLGIRRIGTYIIIEIITNKLFV